MGTTNPHEIHTKYFSNSQNQGLYSSYGSDLFRRRTFFKLVEMTIERLSEQLNPNELKWIPETKAIAILNVKSKSTLQRLRDEGKIGFSQPMHKVILYDRSSLIAYIEKNAQNPF